jgi:hypothetical protein
MNNQISVAEARQAVFSQLDEGIICPCCNQLAKRYERKITSSMACGLIALVKEYQRTRDWVHITELPVGDRRVWAAIRGDFAKLRYWGLIVQRGTSPTSGKRTSGYWKPTQLAMSFIVGKATVPHSYGIFNGKVVSMSPSRVTIWQALTNKFSYSELIKGIPGLSTAADQKELNLEATKGVDAA